MEALKLKIFDVLTEKISVLEFENWLYNSEEFMNQINTNLFCFDLISINYKKEKSLFKIEKLISENYEEDFVLAILILSYCKKILKLNSKKEIYNEVLKVYRKFDYQTDFKSLWVFYAYYHDYDLIVSGILNEKKEINELKQSCLGVLELVRKAKNYREVIKILKNDN